MNTQTHKVIYGCETADGSTGFGEGIIVCQNPTDAKAVWLAIQANPDYFDFCDPDGGKRLVRIDGFSLSTRDLD